MVTNFLNALDRIPETVKNDRDESLDEFTRRHIAIYGKWIIRGYEHIE